MLQPPKLSFRCPAWSPTIRTVISCDSHRSCFGKASAALLALREHGLKNNTDGKSILTASLPPHLIRLLTPPCWEHTYEPQTSVSSLHTIPSPQLSSPPPLCHPPFLAALGTWGGAGAQVPSGRSWLTFCHPEGSWLLFHPQRQQLREKEGQVGFAESILAVLFSLPAEFALRDEVPSTQEDLVPLHKVLYYK